MSPRGNVSRIIVSGYYGHRNFGDEAILERLVHVLQSLSPCSIAVITHDVHATAKRHSSVRPIPARRLLRRIRELRRAQILLLGGGGIIKDSSPSGGVSVGLALVDIIL